MTDVDRKESRARHLHGWPVKRLVGAAPQASVDCSRSAHCSSHQRTPSPLLRVWLLLLPVTSVLLIPPVQGTTPANILALISLIPVLDRLLADVSSRRFLSRVLLCVLALMISLAASQLALSLSHLTPVDFAQVQMASTAPGFYLRPSLLTQSAYLVVGFITFAFFWTHYSPVWDRFILRGALLLAALGFFEVAYSAVTGSAGDFLSNRSFMEGGFSGSLTQFHSLFGPSMMRLKSLTGEPSMYAITAVPYVMLAIHRGQAWTAVALVTSMLLTVSTTAYLGLAMILAFACFRYGRARAWAVMLEAFSACALATLLMLLFREQLLDFIHRVVVTKFTDESVSGAIRSLHAASTFELWTEGSLLTKLFGVGFGFVRSADLATTLLVNVGAVGLLAWSTLYCAPLVRLFLGRAQESWAAWASGFTLVLMLLAVPEFAYPVTWGFLGIAFAHAFVQQPIVRPGQSSDRIKVSTGSRRVHSGARRSAVR